MTNVFQLKNVEEIGARSESCGDCKRAELEEVCVHMIRKDFELMILEHKLQDFLEIGQFYSQQGDDFSSIEHSIKIAFGFNFDSINKEIIDAVKDGAMNVVFECFESRSLVQYDVCVISKRIAHLIFEASLLSDSNLALQMIETSFKEISEFLISKAGA